MKILIIGTGTIGEPLIGFFSDFKEQLEIEEVMFHKRTPLQHERPKVNSLLKRGAKLVVDVEHVDRFLELGHRVSYTIDQAIEESHVIIDCTPAGNKNKAEMYEEYAVDTDKVFIAQGSEKGFGFPYAHGINDKAMFAQNPNFVQVVSCNTHNISSLLKTLDPDLKRILSGDFVCIRRANDISQEEGFISSPCAETHNNKHYGTHHAQDAADLLLTLGSRVGINIFSSAMKLNTQYMHSIRFKITLKGMYPEHVIKEKFNKNHFFATTKKMDSGRIFSFGRDHGYYGRLLNHGVLVEDTLHVHVPPLSGETTITGFCYTPQDGNSLLSSISAVIYSLHGEEKHNTLMERFYDYLYQEV